jgi:hypothetical protein
MAVDATSLTVRYPELAPAVTAAPDMVDACIAQAEILIDRTVYGSKADAAVHALAAHFVAINPLGELGRLNKRNDDTVYLMQYRQLRRSLGYSISVI